MKVQKGNGGYPAFMRNKKKRCDLSAGSREYGEETVVP